MQDQREGNISLANDKSKQLIFIKRIFSTLIISMLLMSISGEVVWADKNGSMVVDSNSFYQEAVYRNKPGGYGGRQSHPWKPWVPWFPWRPWW